MRRNIALAAVAVTAATALAGCSSGGGDAADDPTTLTILTQATSLDWDPAKDVTLPTTNGGLISRRLTTWKIGDDGVVEIVPDLATTTGTPSDGGKTWTFTLKDGLKYSDGADITTADVKYGLERTYSDQLTGGLAYQKGLIAGDTDYKGPYDGDELDSIEVPDAKTIVFHLTTAVGDWPTIASTNPFIPVPEAKDDPATYGKKPVSSGPYAVQSNQDGSKTVLVRNKYWKQSTDTARTAGPDSIVFEQSSSATTAVQSLISDTGDAKTSMVSDPLNAAQLNLIRQDPSAKERLVTSKGGAVNYLAMNTQRGALKDVRVRQALEYAIDRRSIVTAQGGSTAASPATTFTVPGIPGRTDYDLYPAGESGDVTKAKALLAEAGQTNLTLTLWTANDDAFSAMAEAVQQGLAKAGVTVKIKPLDTATLYGDAMSESADYDLFLSYWIPDYPSAAAMLQLPFSSSQINGFNFARYSNSAVDERIAAIYAETDSDAAADDWAALEQQIMKDAPVVPLTFSQNSFLTGSEVHDVTVPAFPPFQNYSTVTVGD